MTHLSVSPKYVSSQRFRALVWCAVALFLSSSLERTIVGHLALVAVFYFGLRLLIIWRSRAQQVSLSKQELFLPAIFTGLKARAIPIEEIQLFGLQQRRGQGRLQITTSFRGYSIPAVALGENGMKTLFDSFFELRKQDEAGRRWLAKRELDRLHLKAFRHLPAHVTRTLMVLILVGYAAEIKWGALELFTVMGGDPIKLLSLGAYSSALSGGEHVYRVISTMFLHAGLLHLYVNGVAFWALGGLLERLLGSSRFFLLYILSGIAGSYVSGFFRDAAPAVGASGAIFGLLGGFLALHFVKMSPLPRSLRQTGRWWAIILCLNVGLPIIVPQIDATAHFAGMAVGGLITALYFVGRSRLGMPGFKLRLVASLAGAATLAMLSVAVRQIDQVDSRDIANTLLEQSARVPSALVNQIAWTRVEERKVLGEDLALAMKAGEERLGVDPDDFHLRDTVASLHFRLGQPEKAKAEEMKAFITAQKARTHSNASLMDGLDSRRIFATQFYRFHGGAPLGEWTLLEFDEEGHAKPASVARYAGLRGFFALRQNDEVLGVLWLQLPLAEVTEGTGAATIRNIVDYRPPPAQITPLFTETFAGSESEFGYFPLSQEVMSLPGPQ